MRKLEIQKNDKIILYLNMCLILSIQTTINMIFGMVNTTQHTSHTQNENDEEERSNIREKGSQILRNWNEEMKFKKQERVSVAESV